MILHRRSFLRLMGVGIVGVHAVGCASNGDTDTGVDSDAASGPPGDDPARPAPPDAPWGGEAPVDDAAFELGVQAGDPTPAGARVWTRAASPGPGTLTLHAAHWDGAAWVALAPVDVEVDALGFAIAELSGAPEGAVVQFQFVDAAGAGSAIGSFWTALGPETPGVVRLGTTSCTHQGHDAFPALAAVAARGPLDAWAWLGDFAYFDGLSDADAYRALWARNLSAPGIRDVLGVTASVWTWDDHEFTNNLDPVADVDKLALGREAFFAHTPVRRDGANPERLWRRVRLGKAVELFVLDCRTERIADQGVYVSEEQLAWLIDGLQTSTATWKLVMNSVPIARLDGSVWDLPLAENDRWEGFPEQRQRLVDALAGVRGVAFLSGDIHCPVLARLDDAGPGASVWDIISGPGGSSLNPASVVLASQASVAWTAVEYNAVRLEAHSTGRMDVAFVAEDGRSLCEAVLGDDGTLHALRQWDEDAGGLVDVPVG
jgi:alkaline phosphatase D